MPDRERWEEIRDDLARESLSEWKDEQRAIGRSEREILRLGPERGISPADVIERACKLAATAQTDAAAKDRRIAELEARLEDASEKFRARGLEMRRILDAQTERNLQLNAMHWVWCSGGCEPTTPLTREIVETAIRNTQRMAQKFNNVEFRTLPLHDRFYYLDVVKRARESAERSAELEAEVAALREGHRLSAGETADNEAAWQREVAEARSAERAEIVAGIRMMLPGSDRRTAAALRLAIAAIEARGDATEADRG